MATGTEAIAFEMLKTMFGGQLYIIGMKWVIPLMVTIMSLLIVTRDVEDWKVMFFPMLALWGATGLKPTLWLYIIGALMMVIEVLSIRLIKGILSTAFKTERGVTKKAKRIVEREDLRKRLAHSLGYMKKKKWTEGGKLMESVEDTSKGLSTKQMLDILKKEEKAKRKGGWWK